MKYFLIILFSFYNFQLVYGQETNAEWDALLSEYVNEDGLVNYKSWVANKKGLDGFLEQQSRRSLEFKSKEAEMAFWINLYNAATIKKVLESYPINSIKEISNGKVWEVKYISVSGNKYSLNQIENDILRKKFNDPRIHFGLNCAAISCPKLYNRAFTATNLNSALNKLTKEFINKHTMVKSNLVVISKIFEWYNEDFLKEGSMINYLNKYMNESIPNTYKVEYAEYNWKLNKQ